MQYFKMLEELFDEIENDFKPNRKFSVCMTNVKPYVYVKVKTQTDKINISLSHDISGMGPGYVRDVCGIVPTYTLKLEKKIPAEWNENTQASLRSELLRLSSYHLEGKSYVGKAYPWNEDVGIAGMLLEKLLFHIADLKIVRTFSSLDDVEWVIDRDGNISKFKITTPRNDIYEKKEVKEEEEISYSFETGEKYVVTKKIIVLPNPNAIKFVESLATDLSLSSTGPLFEGVDVQPTRLFDSLLKWKVEKAEAHKVKYQELSDHPEREWYVYYKGRVDGIDVHTAVSDKLRLKAVAAFYSKEIRDLFEKFEDVFIKHCEEKRI